MVELLGQLLAGDPQHGIDNLIQLQLALEETELRFFAIASPLPALDPLPLRCKIAQVFKVESLAFQPDGQFLVAVNPLGFHVLADQGLFFLRLQ